LISALGRRPWLLSLLAALCTGCTVQPSFQGNNSTELPLPPAIEVAFNQRQDHSYRSPISGQQRPGDNLEELLLQSIHRSQREVLVAVQELSLPQVALALAERQRAGVQVRVVVENSYRQPWSNQHPAGLAPHQRQRLAQLKALADTDRNGELSASEQLQGDAMAVLEGAGVQIIDDTADGSQGSGLMHHKFLVVDQRWVVVGSANFSSSDIHGDAGAPRTRGNVNLLLRFDSPALAQLFKREFELLWNKQFGLKKQEGPAQTVHIGATEVTVLFAPHSKTDPNNGLQVLQELLATAKHQIDLALFVFSAQELADVLVGRVQAGVKLRALVDPGFASRSYSELLDLMGVVLPDQRCSLEAGNAPWQRPISGAGSPRLAPGDKLHHKLAVIDNETVVSGSFNWSPSAAHKNDETMLIIHSPTLAAHFSREMKRLWQGAELGITPKLERKLNKARRSCGASKVKG